MEPRHLYVHVPFCARRCSYCDFSIAVRQDVPVNEYLDALATELEMRTTSLPRAQLDTLYIGGGTPSRLGPAGIAALVSLVGRYAGLANDAEITIEANPDDVTTETAAAWRAAGVNRVSLGVQSFDDHVLRWMHRVHDARVAVQSFSNLRAAGFENISLDLIFALPKSLNRWWRNDLARALELGPEHISLYGLTIEPNTPVARWRARNELSPADEDSYAAEFLVADRVTASAGFEHYEVSNFAMPGRRSRHNSAYWSGAQYLGIGPSAHSFDGAIRSWNVPAYSRWLALLKAGQPATESREILSQQNRLAEKVYLGLRTESGLVVGDADRRATERWRDQGWARLNGSHVQLTPEGWLRLDSLAAALTGI